MIAYTIFYDLQSSVLFIFHKTPFIWISFPFFIKLKGQPGQFSVLHFDMPLIIMTGCLISYRLGLAAPLTPERKRMTYGMSLGLLITYIFR